MHRTAYLNAESFYNKYCLPIKSGEKLKILDIGSYDVNGTLRPLFESEEYLGMDMEEGPNVDVVGHSHDIPFPDNSFDAITSSSCFEHDDMFWISFLEMIRVLKPGGYMYINAPSNGPYHGYPGDNWRFYADSWASLEKWGIGNGYNIKLVESYISSSEGKSPTDYPWEDSVGIYIKGEGVSDNITSQPEHFYENIIPDYFTYPNLYREFVSESTNGSLIVEVGCFLGRSVSFLSVEATRSGKNIQIDCIDSWDPDNCDVWFADAIGNRTELRGIEVYQRFLKNTGSLRNVRPIKMTSVEASQLYENESIDFLMIDGDHSYEAVSEDLKAWFPKVKVGGIISGHDWDHDGVSKAVTEFAHTPNEKLRITEGCWVYRKEENLKQLPDNSDSLVGIFEV